MNISHEIYTSIRFIASICTDKLCVINFKLLTLMCQHLNTSGFVQIVLIKRKKQMYFIIPKLFSHENHNTAKTYPRNLFSLYCCKIRETYLPRDLLSWRNKRPLSYSHIILSPIWNLLLQYICFSFTGWRYAG